MKIGKKLQRTLVFAQKPPDFPSFPKYEKFNVMTSELDDKALSLADEVIETHLISALKGQNTQQYRKVGLFAQATGQGFLRLVRRLLGKLPDFTETLVQPVWAHPCDWNSFFELALNRDYLGSFKNLYWAGVNSSCWVKSLEDTDLILASLPGKQKKPESQEKLDLQIFLKHRVDEIKTHGKILLVNQIDVDGSWNDLFSLVNQSISLENRLNLDERKLAGIDFGVYKEQDLIDVVDRVDLGRKIVYQQVVCVDIGDQHNRFESLGKILKEKVGGKVFFALDKRRKFEERQEIMRSIFDRLDGEVKVSFMKPFRYTYQISILA